MHSLAENLQTPVAALAHRGLLFLLRYEMDWQRTVCTLDPLSTSRTLPLSRTARPLLRTAPFARS